MDVSKPTHPERPEVWRFRRIRWGLGAGVGCVVERVGFSTPGAARRGLCSNPEGLPSNPPRSVARGATVLTRQPDRQRQHPPAPGRVSPNPKPTPKSCAGACCLGFGRPQPVPPDSVGTVPPHPSKPRQCPFSGSGCVFVVGLAPWDHPTQLARSEAVCHVLQPRRRLGLPSQAPARRFIGGWLRFLGWVGAWGGLVPGVGLARPWRSGALWLFLSKACVLARACAGAGGWWLEPFRCPCSARQGLLFPLQPGQRTSARTHTRCFKSSRNRYRYC